MNRGEEFGHNISNMVFHRNETCFKIFAGKFVIIKNEKKIKKIYMFRSYMKDQINSEI